MGKRIVFLLIVLATLSPVASAQRALRESGEAQWIWAPSGQRGGDSVAFFRKQFVVRRPVFGEVEIACDDHYDLYVNGRRIGRGSDWRVLDRYDIKPYLTSGRNVIAIRAEKRSTQRRAGLVARVILRGAGGTYVSHSTDSSWRCSTTESPRWRWASFNDSRWNEALSLGELGRAQPWGTRVRPADGSTVSRFKAPPDFHVERVLAPKQCGSLVTMAFDEWGNILASSEDQGLLLIEDRDENGSWETVVPFSQKLKNVQGILPINREVYAVGDGPEGTGLYRLVDEDGDGKGETAEALLKFKGGMGEHGAHAPTLGPDGWIYLVIGNHATLDTQPAATSPYRHWYEGDLNQPRYEDPGGHAVGVKAPGGTVVRVTLDGKTVEYVAGGLRNAYDIAFNADGELFTYDSDMEWDEGTPWYRATRVVHVVSGGEYGWRSGWAKWPKYFVDNLPPLVETGRGSPTGVELYDHKKFPEEYRGAMFICDWTMGRILSLRMKPAHGTYKVTSEVFLEGKPLNVTDVAVGPDGWLYFCTGGRGTEGGIYRVVYTGRAPAERRLAGIGRAVRQPQFYSAFGRDVIATVQEELGEEWDRQIISLVGDRDAAPRDRVRGLDLMHLYGPFPKPELLLRLSRDREFSVRARAAAVMAQHSNDATRERLAEMLSDGHPNVRRHACEALIRCGHHPPVEKVLPLLADASRFVTWAARRLLEEMPVDTWRAAILETKVPRVFNLGAMALLSVEGNRSSAEAVLGAASMLMNEFLNDGDFVDLLRVMQVALHRGRIAADDVSPELRKQLSREYPVLTGKNPVGARRINRELVRLLVYLQEPSLARRLVAQLRSEEPLVEKLHLALYARFLTRGWTTDQKLELLEYYEQARKTEGGYSLSRYIDNVAREFVATFTAQERGAVLQEATRWPTAALGVLVTLPEHPGEAMLKHLEELDQQLRDVEGEPARKLQTGIVAILARSKDEAAMAYLRDVFDKYPERRAMVAMGLAQSPGGKNWPRLIRALPILDGAAANEVLTKLKLVGGGPPKNAESVRQVILCGIRLKQHGAQHAVALLEHWYDEGVSQPSDSWDVALRSWQKWFVGKFPKLPPPVPPKSKSANKWDFDDLLAHLTDEKTRGNAARGARVFAKALCIKCHRFGRIGEPAGPDLTTVASRFHKREVLEAILYPSHVISDQYAAKTVVTNDGRQFTGIVGSAGSNAIVVLQTNGEKVGITRDNVDQIVPSKLSAMPEGLLNELELEEVVDLFEYLYHSPPERTTRRPRGRR